MIIWSSVTGQDTSWRPREVPKTNLIFINHFINGKSLSYSQDWKGLMELERIMPGGRERRGGGDQEQFVQIVKRSIHSACKCMVRRHIGNGCTSLVPSNMFLGMHIMHTHYNI